VFVRNPIRTGWREQPIFGAGADFGSLKSAISRRDALQSQYANPKFKIGNLKRQAKIENPKLAKC
jgi:hypothetical protein